MLLFTVLVIVCAVVFCLALAASSSPVYGFNSNAELTATLEGTEEVRSAAEPKGLVTSHQGVPSESQPVVFAAGLQ
jgi:hypothetical protein